MKKVLWLAILGLGAIGAAEAQSWQIDPNHTAAQFAVRHMGVSTVRGSFEKTSGTVIFDPADPSKTSIDATINTASVSTRVQMRDDDLRSPHFFDVAKYPTITFKSTHAEAAGSGKLRIAGDLTIHGVTKPVVLDVDGPSEVIHDPMGNLRMGANATTKINRNDFGITTLPGVVGDEIQIILDVELIRPAAAK